jgi:hypothetical protein
MGICVSTNTQICLYTHLLSCLMTASENCSHPCLRWLIAVCSHRNHAQQVTSKVKLLCHTHAYDTKVLCITHIPAVLYAVQVYVMQQQQHHNICCYVTHLYLIASTIRMIVWLCIKWYLVLSQLLALCLAVVLLAHTMVSNIHSDMATLDKRSRNHSKHHAVWALSLCSRYSQACYIRQYWCSATRMRSHTRPVQTILLRATCDQHFKSHNIYGLCKVWFGIYLCRPDTAASDGFFNNILKTRRLWHTRLYTKC